LLVIFDGTNIMTGVDSRRGAPSVRRGLVGNPPLPRERLVTIIARDPALKVDNRIVRAQVLVPAETLAPGPIGYRVAVIDYDASNDTLYIPRPLANADADPFASYTDKQLLEDPQFHRHNAYALVMRTLARFEFALGRRIGWGFYGHQLKIAPHAFADANAFYSGRENALLLGYFPGKKHIVYTCLSHDVVVHETTHALVDGLRKRYTDPSSPDQAAFHEGFADVVALLSVFALPSVVELMLPGTGPKVDVPALTVESLRASMIFGLAHEVGDEIGSARGQPLRRSLELRPSSDYLDREEYKEPHRRGEVLVAAMLTAFIDIWVERLHALVEQRTEVDRARAVEEGRDIADTLLTSAIRAIDYAPPVDLEFGDYLSAFVTGDREIRPGDERYGIRKGVHRAFAAYGIDPASPLQGGYWRVPDAEFDYSRTHFEPMQRDKEEVFHFLVENHEKLQLDSEAFTRVTSVRPCLRVGRDGFVLRETVCEYVQTLETFASELSDLEIRKPSGMPRDQKLTLYGGGVLIFDEYGRVKFHIYNKFKSGRQARRLKYLWEYGFFIPAAAARLQFSSLHRQRASGTDRQYKEEW
jgi:hypothetical protein